MKAEMTIKKIKIDSSMIGQDVLIPDSQKSFKTLKSLPYALDMIGSIKYQQQHNIRRHGLFWACIGLVSDNTGKADYEIEEAVKIDCRWIKGYITYTDKHNKERINVITKSISFFSMTLEEANDFYSKAFDILAGYIGVDTETMIAEAKEKMLSKHYCVLCGAKATDKHHKFSQSKINIAKYGRDLINNEFNIEWLCNACHASHNKIPKELNWSEARFIKEAKSRGFLQNSKDDLINTFEGEEVKNENNG